MDRFWDYKKWEGGSHEPRLIAVCIKALTLWMRSSRLASNSGKPHDEYIEYTTNDSTLNRKVTLPNLVWFLPS